MILQRTSLGIFSLHSILLFRSKLKKYSDLNDYIFCKKDIPLKRISFRLHSAVLDCIRMFYDILLQTGHLLITVHSSTDK